MNIKAKLLEGACANVKEPLKGQMSFKFVQYNDELPVVVS